MKSSTLINSVFYLFCVFTYTAHSEQSEPFLFTILHTNDLHSHVSGSGPRLNFTSQTNDGDNVVGHYARLVSQIKNYKLKSPVPTLTLDAGDWYGGTLYQWLGPRKDNDQVPELEFFQNGEYDYTVLGNHEFDAGPEGLITMLDKMRKLVPEGKPRFKILASNLEEKFFNQLPKDMVEQTVIKELEYQGKKLKVGLIGLLGPDGQRVSATQRKGVQFVGFDDDNMKAEEEKMYELVSKLRDELKKQGAQVIGVLLHGGTPEDVALAQNVSDLDFIIAGHTHELYPRPQKIGKTYIVQAGCYGQWLGVVPLSWRNGSLELIDGEKSVTHQAITDKTPVDEAYLKQIGNYDGKLEELVATRGFSLNRPLVEVTADMEKNPAFASLVLDKVKVEVAKDVASPVDLYFTTLSLVRSGLKKGTQTYEDLFKVFSIGMDMKDFAPGADLYHFYFSKNEVKLLIEFLELYSLLTKNFKPAFTSNLKYRVRWWGIPMINRLVDLTLDGKQFEAWPERISMATNSNIVNYFDKVKTLSYGMVEFHPTDKNLQPLSAPAPIGKKESEFFARGMEDSKTFP